MPADELHAVEKSRLRVRFDRLTDAAVAIESAFRYSAPAPSTRWRCGSGVVVYDWRVGDCEGRRSSSSLRCPRHVFAHATSSRSRLARSPYAISGAGPPKSPSFTEFTHPEGFFWARFGIIFDERGWRLNHPLHAARGLERGARGGSAGSETLGV